MSDLIRLLPDGVVNQIAAGEVIQRPASVVKELLDNAVDSGAGEIKLLVKEAGKLLIQVNDNGCGMGPTDARMSFERHATSKIKSAEDLFAIQTKVIAKRYFIGQDYSFALSTTNEMTAKTTNYSIF